MPLTKRLYGRTDSILRFPDGRVLFPIAFIGTMESFELFNHVEEYKMVQKKANQLVIYIQKKAHSPDERLFRNTTIEYFSRFLNIDLKKVNIEVEFLDNIQTTIGGKHKTVLSEVSA